MNKLVAKKAFLLLVLACAMLVTVEPIYAKKKKNTKTAKKESPYEKIFKGKKDEVITLHKIEGKILVEFPLTLQNREMLLGTTVSEISDNGNALVGQKIKKLLHIKFALRDSVMEMREVSNFARRPIFSTSKDESIKEAMKKGIGEPVMEGFKVMAYNAGSTVVVFDMTDFGVSNNKRMAIFDPYGKKTFDAEVTALNAETSQGNQLGVGLANGKFFVLSLKTANLGEILGDPDKKEFERYYQMNGRVFDIRYRFRYSNGWT